MTEARLMAGFWRRRAGLLTSVAAATAWTGLALRNEGVTYHFAPLIVAGVWPIVGRYVAHRPVARRAGAWAAFGGANVALYTTFELGLLGALDGPTLWGSQGAAGESVAFAVIGAAFGWWQSTKTRAGILFTGEDAPAEGSARVGGSPTVRSGSTEPRNSVHREGE